jgi:hypothetical protein
MFKQIRYIFLIFLSSIAVSSMAQRDTTLTREVEVTKTFKPTISDANKINEMPKIDETEHQIPTFDYQIFSQPIINTFSVNPLKAATIANAQKKETGYGLIKAGVGNYNKPYAEFFFNHLNSKKSIFGIHARHLSSYGKIKLEGGDKVDAPYSNSVADLYYKYDFGKSVLSLDADYSHNGFKYYGYPVDPIPPVLLEEDQQIDYQGTKQAFSKGGININLKNPVAELDDAVFNFDLDYHYFGTKTKQTEHFGEFNMDFQKPFETGTLLGDVGATFSLVDGIYNNSLNEPGKRQQTWLYLKPAYFYGGKLADIKVGFNAWYVMDKDMDVLAKITPNVLVNFRPVEDVINLYVGVDGKYTNNHYSKIAYENQFVDPMHDVTNSFEKLRFYGGIDGKFSSKTNFKIGVDYSMIDDNPFYYLNEYYYPDPIVNPNPLIVNNTFDVLYDDINLLKFNIEIFHASSERLNLLLSGNYYAYNLEEQAEAWNMPNWDATFSVDYKITEQLSMGADIYLIGGRKALIKESLGYEAATEESSVPPINKSFNLDTAFDLNINANYQITQKFAVFGQLNNFGFQQYQRWLGYPVQSFNALVGISFAF